MSNRETGNIFLVPISDRVGKRGGERGEEKPRLGRHDDSRRDVLILGLEPWDVERFFQWIRIGWIDLLLIMYNVCQKCGKIGGILKNS